MGGDGERVQANDPEQNRRYSPRDGHGDACGGGARLAVGGRVGGDRAHRVAARLAGVELETTRVQFREVDRLASRQRRVVGDRGELAANEEGVADIHGQPDRHYQGD